MWSDGRVAEAASEAVASYDEVLAAFTNVHRRLGDRRPRPTAEDRSLEAAAWELSGHFLATSTAHLQLLRNGFGVQSEPLLRALFETQTTLAAVVMREAEDLRERWLSDQAIPQLSSFRVLQRLERRLEETGELPPGEPLRPMLEEAYAIFSAGPHGRRSAIRRSIGAEGFEYGAAPGSFQHAIATILTGLLLRLSMPSLVRALAEIAAPEDADDLTSLDGADRQIQRALHTIATAVVDSLNDSRQRAEGR